MYLCVTLSVSTKKEKRSEKRLAALLSQASYSLRPGVSNLKGILCATRDLN